MEDGYLERADFLAITGIELESDEEIAMFNRANSRASRKLAQYLGWAPTYKSVYAEIAKSKLAGSCPTEEQLEQWQSDPEEYDFFEDPDTENGQIKLFPYYAEDANYFIDPAIAVYNVKLVKILSKDTQQFITVYEFAPDDWLQKVNHGFIFKRTSVINWLEICKAPTTLPCRCEEGRSCYMLAVDADWINQVPEDLKYVLADLILYYMKTQPNLTQITDYAVSSESVDGHSVSYNTNIVKQTDDELLDKYNSILKNYIGPFSVIYVNKTRVS